MNNRPPEEHRIISWFRSLLNDKKILPSVYNISKIRLLSKGNPKNKRTYAHTHRERERMTSHEGGGHHKSFDIMPGWGFFQLLLLYYSIFASQPLFSFGQTTTFFRPASLARLSLIWSASRSLLAGFVRHRVSGAGCTVAIKGSQASTRNILLLIF